MKTIILIMFSLILLISSLSGQDDNFSFLNRNKKKDLNIENRLSGFKQIDTTFRLVPNHDLLHRRNSRRFDLNPDRIMQYPLKIIRSRTYAYAEEYPGSSVYYAKRPSLLQTPDEKFFIKKPDPFVKYYLIIKDPLNHAIIK